MVVVVVADPELALKAPEHSREVLDKVHHWTQIRAAHDGDTTNRAGLGPEAFRQGALAQRAQLQDLREILCFPRFRDEFSRECRAARFQTFLERHHI